MTIPYAYLSLAVAVICEVAGSSFLLKSAGLTKWLPSAVALALYGSSFTLLTQVLRVLPLGFVNATWGGSGIILTSLVGLLVFRQTLDGWAVLGLALIISGILVLNLLSKSIGQ